MYDLPIFQVDAFTNATFGGNPACVVPLEEGFADDDVLLKIAQENHVAETAFFVRRSQGDDDDDENDEDFDYHLRWFTPEFEMDLCGHATLAAAHVLRAHLGHGSFPIRFQTASGPLAVDYQQDGGGWYHLDFPSRRPQPAELPDIISQALSHGPRIVLKARDYVLVYDTEEEIRNVTIDRHTFDQINPRPRRRDCYGTGQGSGLCFEVFYSAGLYSGRPSHGLGPLLIGPLLGSDVGQVFFECSAALGSRGPIKVRGPWRAGANQRTGGDLLQGRDHSHHQRQTRWAGKLKWYTDWYYSTQMQDTDSSAMRTDHWSNIISPNSRLPSNHLDF